MSSSMTAAASMTAQQRQLPAASAAPTSLGATSSIGDVAWDSSLYLGAFAEFSQALYARLLRRSTPTR